MAIKLDERYPGRATPASTDYPQGSFKNRTSPTAKDGTYLEKDWANDQQGFLQSLLSKAGVVANGLVDKVGASQYYDALISTIRGSKATEAEYGVTRYATDVESNAGLLDNCSITPKKMRAGVSLSLGSTGYLALPTWLGGIIFQWGSFSGAIGGTVAVTYTSAFPTAAWHVISFYINGSDPGAAADVGGAMIYGALTTTGFNARLRTGYGGGRYLAIGN